MKILECFWFQKEQKTLTFAYSTEFASSNSKSLTTDKSFCVFFSKKKCFPKTKTPRTRHAGYDDRNVLARTRPFTLDIRADSTRDGGSDPSALAGLVSDLAGSPARHTLTLQSGLLAQDLTVNGNVEVLLAGTIGHSTIGGLLDLFSSSEGVPSGALLNAAGSTLMVTDGSIIHAPSNLQFVNAGVATLVAATLEGSMTNNGTVVVDAGEDTGTTVVYGSLANTGVVQVDDGAEVKFAGSYVASGTAQIVGDGILDFVFGGSSFTGTQAYTAPAMFIETSGQVTLNTPALRIQGLQEAADTSMLEVANNASVLSFAVLAGTIDSNQKVNVAFPTLDLAEGGSLAAAIILSNGVWLASEGNFSVTHAVEIGVTSGDAAVLYNRGTMRFGSGASITGSDTGILANGDGAVLVSMPGAGHTVEVPGTVSNSGSILVGNGDLKLDHRLTGLPSTAGARVEVSVDSVLEPVASSNSLETIVLDAGALLRLGVRPLLTDGSVAMHIGGGLTIANFVATDSTYAAGVMTLTDGLNTAALHLTGLDSGERFLVHPDELGGTAIAGIACFRSGTLIQTCRGEIAIEAALPGDQVLAHFCDGRVAAFDHLDRASFVRLPPPSEAGTGVAGADRGRRVRGRRMRGRATAPRAFPLA